MESNSFTATCLVDKSAKEVFACIKEVPKWWSIDFDGRSSALNDEFVIHHPNQHFTRQKLVEVIPDKKMVWLVTDSMLNWLEKDQHEWTNTKMVFELVSEDEKTRVHFTHEGLIPEKECYTRCSQGWAVVIQERLFNYITRGEEI